MSQTGELESPRRYFYFAGLSVLSAVVRRNLFLDRGGAYKLYPNIYCMLVGPSGIKKGLPISVAEKLVTTLVKEGIRTKVIAGRSSIQAIIENLGHVEQAKDGSIEKKATGFIVSGEFSQSILEDPQALTILTDLYDSQYKDEHTNLLKSGKSVLREVYLTMLGASNEAHLHAVIGQRDIMGGFIARTLMVSENKRNKKNSLVWQQKTGVNYESLLPHLRKVAKLNGEFHYTDAAAKFYDDWYNDVYEADNNDETGTSNRVPDTILKVAMLLSLSRDTNLFLEVEDIEEAIDVCTTCMWNARQVTGKSPGATTTPIANQTVRVLGALFETENYKQTRQALLQKLWRHVDAYALTLVIDTLKEANVLTEEKLGKDTWYVLADHAIKEYEKNKEKVH